MRWGLEGGGGSGGWVTVGGSRGNHPSPMIIGGGLLGRVSPAPPLATTHERDALMRHDVFAAVCFDWQKLEKVSGHNGTH